jgi:3-methyladenine DNA glycosylase/8-oxoguanine DNA glycosylase
MSRLRYNRQVAVEHLRNQCGPLRRFIDDFGGLQLKVHSENDLFNALARSIVYQQLSGKAAATIHGRFTTLFDDSLPEAGQASRLSMEQLRSVGLSRNKSLAILDLAEKSQEGSLASTDLGVQKGAQAVYRMQNLPNPKQLLQKTRHLAPYRSAASWYFWRAADTNWES